jgi:hypothetical protein
MSEGTPVCEKEKKKKRKKKKEAFVSSRRLLQYFRLPNKNSRDISRYIYNFLRYFRIVTYLFHSSSRRP